MRSVLTGLLVVSLVYVGTALAIIAALLIAKTLRPVADVDIEEPTDYWPVTGWTALDDAQLERYKRSDR